ncbi:GntR family transcriptional regulator [Aureimonas sp. ME7]|uniref:GntR family transcriptional regulator n=1 Tax=Aureimonas sp. ME7 TaxID=2744252 RepID=UPI0015F4A613|nr:GntR family transcriptional regulator [Aureimonas sp. ME7]
MRDGSPERKRSDASWRPIHDGILDAIIRHRLAPGAKLVEEEIAALYGVSRTLVRVALQDLARQGVVLLRRNKGACVACPGPEEAREIFEARALIEPELAARAARRMRPADTQALRASIDAEHHALHLDNPREAVFHSADFHRRIAGIAGHGVLSDIVGELLSRSSLVISLYWRQPQEPCANAAHLQLIEAISGGQPALSARLMREHVEALFDQLDLSPPRAPSNLSVALGIEVAKAQSTDED